ncbi:GIY-YIG nuclease family protein [Sphingomonas colocasiae]|uniref:GIY-YIG nuclease family protein n=1 Tax=Sphingomonas colocasiae TaxID=1848973 RepID=A0ABS7PLI9_9SPHN|nr:GIY-YIG nuclease family protein [Sphingomonas colocasiae]
MKAEDRKAAVSAYKERKVEAGIYAVRCAASGETWVGRAPDLSTIGNRIWFTLRQGIHSNRPLQQAWNTHGPDAFAFEIVERLEDEDSAYIRDRVLNDRLVHWVERLQATRI